MNDQEVKEYMHRFLDDDLSEEEVKQLERHLHESPGSAVLFERLKRLNSELEQLPRVSPPVSIVDSILPQLERAGLLEQPPELGGGTAAAVSPASRQTPPRRFRTWRDRIHYKAAGSVIAAGIVLTLLIINAPELKVQTANDMAGGSASGNAAAPGAEMNMAYQYSVQGDNAPAAADARESAGDAKYTGEAPQSGEPESRMIAGDESLAPAEALGTGATEYPEAAPGGGDVRSGAPLADGGRLGEPAVKEPEVVVTTTGSGGTDEGTGAGAEESGQQSAAQEGRAPQEDALPQQLADDRQPADEQIGESARLESGDGPQWLKSVAAEPVASPSGTLFASIAAEAEGERIVIVDNEGLTVYESRLYAGALGQLQWSDDAETLTFEWITGEDTLLMAIDTRTKTEFVK